jgi:hypothetical protein
MAHSYFGSSGPPIAAVLIYASLNLAAVSGCRGRVRASNSWLCSTRLALPSANASQLGSGERAGGRTLAGDSGPVTIRFNRANGKLDEVIA